MTAIQKPSIKRVWHPYWLWEETYTSMWGSSENREALLKKAIKFTGNHKLYGKWMMRVVEQWPLSCEHNLTCVTQNRKAWIGHAACALAFNCPEDIVRQAWRYLSEEQQTLANMQAQNAIEAWERKYIGGPWQRNLWA